MPRKPIRSKKTKAVLSEPMKYFLETGDYCLLKRFPDYPKERFEIFKLANPFPSMREKLRLVWIKHKKEILEKWKAEGRADLPWAAKEFDE